MRTRSLGIRDTLPKDTSYDSPMANWEYKHVVLGETDAEVKVIEAKLAAEISGTENILNHFGAAGMGTGRPRPVEPADGDRLSRVQAPARLESRPMTYFDADLLAAALPNYEVGRKSGAGAGVSCSRRVTASSTARLRSRSSCAFRADPSVRCRFVSEALLLACWSIPSSCRRSTTTSSTKACASSSWNCCRAERCGSDSRPRASRRRRRAASSSPRAPRWSTRTRRASSTATSSRRTCCSPRPAR